MSEYIYGENNDENEEKNENRENDVSDAEKNSVDNKPREASAPHDNVNAYQQSYGQPQMQPPQPQQPQGGYGQYNGQYGAGQQQGQQGQPQSSYYQYNPYYYGGQYGYGYGTPTPPPKPPKKKKRGKAPVVIALVVLVALVVASTIFVGAAYMTGQDTPADGTETVDASGKIVDAADETAAQDGKNGPAGFTVAPNSLGTSEKGTIADVVAEVADSVVEITTEYTAKDSFYYSSGAGSGVIISEDGYIVTNNHVITSDTYGNASTINVRLTNGETYPATLYGKDTDTDIAIIKIDAEGLKPAKIGMSSNLVVGEEVVIIGNPLGTLGGSVTNGIISALDREITVGDETMNLLQTNAAVNPGNSGGGMFNMAGELVGIVNAKYSETGIEGLGFAIPIDDVTSVTNDLLELGYVPGRVSFKITVLNIDDYQKLMQYRVNSFGIYVNSADEGYNDDQVEPGDRIVQLDGVEITDFADVRAVLKSHKVGDKVSGMVIRGGRYVNIELECFERGSELNIVDE